MTDQSDGSATPPSPQPAEPEDASPAEELTEAVTEGVAEAVTEALGPEAAAAAADEVSPGEPAETVPTAEPSEPVEPDEMTTTAEPTEAAVEEAPVAAEAEPEPEPAPAPGGPGIAEPVAAVPEPPAEPAGGERLEWRPVATGEQIEWQPVAVPDDEPVEAEEAWDERAGDDDFDPDAGWDQPSAGAAAAMAGNGAAGPRTRPARPTRPRPASGRPGTRPSGGRRPPGRPAGARPARREPAYDEDDGDGGALPPAGSKAKRQVVILSVLTVVVLLVAVVGFVLSRGATKTGNEATATSVPTTGGRPTGGTTVPPADLVSFKDDQTGFTIKYPKTWNRLSAPVADIRTVLLPGVGNANAVSVRVIPINTPADQQNIGNFKAVTDTIAFGDQRNRLIQEQLVTLNGKLTYYYVYTFKDEATNQEGVHAHYFVFEGLRMFSLVFQALPAEEFTRLAAVYDQVAESFTVEPVRTTVAPTSAPPTTG